MEKKIPFSAPPPPGGKKEKKKKKTKKKPKKGPKGAPAPKPPTTPGGTVAPKGKPKSKKVIDEEKATEQLYALLKGDLKRTVSSNIIKKQDITFALINFIPELSLLEQGIPAIIQRETNEVLMHSVYGLNFFLKSWYKENENDPAIIADMLTFLNNLKDYIEYSGRVLKFIKDKGRIPEKDEAWDLEIPIDEMDFTLNLINVDILDNAFSSLNLKEKKHYDNIAKSVIISGVKLEEMKLEALLIDFQLSLIDAKILPIFISDLFNIKDLDQVISNYINLPNLTPAQLTRLNNVGTGIIKANAEATNPLNLIDLVKKVNAGLMEIQEALYLIQNINQVLKEDAPLEDVDRLSKTLIEAIIHCQNSATELTEELLITKYNLDLIGANEIIMLYGKTWTLPPQLSRGELRILDETSKSVIKYIKEINESPSVDDLMINLSLNIRNASIIFAFINKISTEDIQEDYEKYPEKQMEDIDALACEILKLENKDDLDLINLAYHFETGIYSVKRALTYISWIEKRVDDNYIKNIRVQERKVIGEKIKSALIYIREKSLALDFNLLINQIGFSLRDTHLVIGLYNNIISKEIDITSFTGEKQKQIEALSRQIYNAKKSGQISVYEAEEVFTLDLVNADMDMLWEAITYLQVKVLGVLRTETKLVKTSIGEISTAGAAQGTIKLREKHGIKIGKKGDIKLSKDKIKLQESGKKIKFKSSAGKVVLKRGMDFKGGLVRYKVAIQNNTETIISNLDVQLKMTAEHIRVVDISPRVYKRGDRAQIPSMAPGQSQSIDFYLEPMICGSIPASPIVSYVDAFGKPKMVSRESLNVVSKCPPIVNPGEENIANVKNIFEKTETTKSFRSFEIKEEMKADQVFSLLMEAIGAWAGRTVSKPITESDNPFIREVYYYVLNQNVDPDLGHQEHIIIKLRVDAGKRIAMIHIGAEKPPTVNGILTHVWEMANHRLGQVYGFEFKSLRCPGCGGSLEEMSRGHEKIKCKYCRTEFTRSSIM